VQKLEVVVFLVNGSYDSPMGTRARAFAARLEPDFQIHTGYRAPNKIRAIGAFFRLLRQTRTDTCYVLDMGYSGVLAAALYKLFFGCRIITDTGDAIYQLACSMGGRGRLALWLTKLLEQLSLRASDALVVRSHYHRDWLAERGFDATVVPDGVDPAQFFPQDTAELRRKYGLEGVTTIGVLGSIVWNARWQMCYGWELIELIRLLRDEPVKGIIIGDGDGIDQLKMSCAEYKIEDRILFLGRVPYDKLPAMLNMMDICLSTQTNDLAGQVRTTGKLPLYLACGRHVLATEVGEAARVLPPSMLVAYEGVKDPRYPERLAARVRELVQDADRLNGTGQALAVGVAKSNFDYAILADRVRRTLGLERSSANSGSHPRSRESVPVIAISPDQRPEPMKRTNDIA
jgi:glycosyltransferase involved in cell wall biosynthesis